MNTYKKGDDFESSMELLIRKMLSEGNLLVSEKLCVVYRKKGYYSESRKGDIIVDISIECTLHNAPTPSLYIIVECKNTKKAIVVDDLEEFYAKTQQITGLNVKAMLLTASSLQTSALNFAISKGIAVMKINPDGRHEMMSFRKDRGAVNLGTAQFQTVVNAITEPEKTPFSPFFTGVAGAKCYFDIGVMITDIINTGT